MTIPYVVVSLALLVLRTSAAMQPRVGDGASQEVTHQPIKKSQHLHDCYQNTSRCESLRFYSISSLEEMKSKLSNCCVIEGDLQLLLSEKHNSWDNATFPRLVEITGYLLVYRVYNLKSLGSLFPNLATIRGSSTFQGYSLIVNDNRDLQEVGLYSLTSILNGYVRIQNNINLCFGDDYTIDWNQICKAEDSRKKNHFSDNFGMMCGPCPNSCKSGKCWSTTVCQPYCKESCKGDCEPTTGECCHDQCAGGCTEPDNSKACITCKNFNNYKEDECVESCTEINLRKLHNYLCIGGTECENKVGYKCYKDHECVKTCPPGYSNRANVNNCKKCEGDEDCGKYCNGLVVNTIEKVQTLRGCTTVNGTLVIRITGGRDIAEKLEDALKNIKSVTGYIRIFNSKSLLSLNFFKSLSYIGGRPLLKDKYALYVHDNDNLESIWENRSTNLSIRNGEIFFHSNPKLCYKFVEKLLNNTNITVINKEDKELMKSLN